MKLLASITLLLLANQAALTAPFKLSRAIINKPGTVLTSSPKIEIPKGLIVQGSEVHYKVTSTNSSQAISDFTCHFGFDHMRGMQAFQKPQGSNTNFFKADWYGQNVVKVTITNKRTGEVTHLTDKPFCHFASRQVLGGNADLLSKEACSNIRRGDIHDIRKPEKGMAYLPKDISRGDSSSEQLTKGFFETTEPRIFQTKKGTLIAAIQARRIGKNDAPAGQGIVVKRSTDQGSSWTHELLLDQDANDVWGYSALVEVDSTLYCYAVAGHPGHQDANRKIRGIYYYTSQDEGKTWSQRKRHDQLSALIGIEPSKPIPSGASPNCNILVVPRMTLDGNKAPEGHGLLFSTYAHGYIWASIDGGKSWRMVADHRSYADAKNNGYQHPVQIENELAWCTLDNPEGDIYMVWRRQSFKGYKNEYLVSRHFRSGKLGMKVKKIYNQELKNIQARRCHFGIRKIAEGQHKGKILLATQGSGSRNHIRLGLSRMPLNKNSSIPSKLFDEVTVMKDIGWGYCDITYLNAAHPAHQSMGKDAIFILGESEPIHTKTYQFIPLKPSGKGKNERYSTTAFTLSVEYFEFLKKQ
ncbi:exo-alpha-sialidase [Verrucomicrobiaceae bacterium N1E253]|uniref:exo-alpha-sialidase n=1 Tax=Oceaniferula marina TaxID=2748318 RepID=A0A851GHS0_9BACT|nr:sialidase family protein [Oceaniferula marina]NWK57073.1 exo-alpha-sialidase [Oceaniferula marina]